MAAPQLTDVIWKPLLIADPPVASLEKVKQWEIEFGYKLPTDFIEIARTHQGCYPVLKESSPETVTMLDAVSGLFHFERDPQYRFSLLGNVDYIAEYRPGALVFVDWSGDALAFDYGQNPQREEPPVIHWQHESKEVVVVAENFTGLLEKCLAGGW